MTESMRVVAPTSPGGKWRAICDASGCPRPLDWTVATESHARNLVAKHDRDYHQDVKPVAEAPVDGAPKAYVPPF